MNNWIDTFRRNALGITCDMFVAVMGVAAGVNNILLVDIHPQANAIAGLAMILLGCSIPVLDALMLREEE